jgi:hypothetical protein
VTINFGASNEENIVFTHGGPTISELANIAGTVGNDSYVYSGTVEVPADINWFCDLENGCP